MDTNNQTIFHSTTDETRQRMEADRQKIADHVSMHYRKYLFGMGALWGFLISLIARLATNTNILSGQLNADRETSPEIQALGVFDEMMSFAHEKDNFFHMSGKIYTLTGETLFKKYDTMFHMLDNSYHKALSLQERLKRAQKFADFIKIQNTLFDSTEYEYGEYNNTYEKLNKQFDDMLIQIPTVIIQDITGTIENTSGAKK